MTTVSKTNDAGVTAAGVDQQLRKGYFVKRGEIMKAFGLTRDDMDAMVPDVFTPAPNPKFRYARFVRSQVVEIARQWERTKRA